MIFSKLNQFIKTHLIARLLLFLFLLAAIWSPFAIAGSTFLNHDPNLMTIVTMGCLFVVFLGLQKVWGIYVYNQPKIFQQYGLHLDRINLITLIKGLAIGFCVCWGLFITEAILGWLEFTASSEFIVKIVIEGLISALGIALAEELVFRGWVLFEVEQDLSKLSSLWISSLLFAIAHFLKPIAEIVRTLVNFPALVLLGLVLVWAKRGSYNRLSMAIGIHAGLIWSYYILNVGQLIEYTNVAPTWMTGIDGNPLAGILGLCFMGILAVFMRRKALAVLR